MWNKFGARRVRSHAGFSFSSKLEASLYDYLALMEKNGEISDITLQPHVMLTEAKIKMIPDFKARHLKMGQDVYFEAKGYETDVWRIKRKLWTVYGPSALFVYRGSYKKLELTEVIIPCVH